MHSDLIVIGAGPGGYETALEAAARGLSVTLVNGGELGGTCLNHGCIPTKCMVRDANVAMTLREASGICADEVHYDIDFNKIIARRNAVVSQLRDGVSALLQKAKVNVVNGKACFRDSNVVTVDGLEYDAPHIIIATGSHSKSLPVPGADQKWVLDSSAILKLEFVPAELVVIGGGVIGMEFASIFAALGSKVTVIEYMKQILPSFDSDIAKRLKQALVKRGVNIITGGAVTALEQNYEYKVEVHYTLKGEEHSILCDNLLMAVGRGPNVEGLGLENAGIDFSPAGIAVNDNMQTNVPGVYAIGDVNGRMMLAHVAVAQGKRALNHILGKSDDLNFSVVPSAAFTVPECGMAGLTEEQCKEQGIPIKVGKSFYRANGKALAMGESDGYCKLIFHKDSGRLIGAHIMGADAALLVQQCADLMNLGATKDRIGDIIFGHPTLSEVILSAANS